MTIKTYAPGTLPDELATKIFRLRYDIFIDEMGYPDPHADKATNMIEDVLDETAHHIVVTNDQEIIGLGRINALKDRNFEDVAEIYQLELLGSDYARTTALSTRLMVAPAYRRKRTPMQICIEQLKIVRSQNCNWCVICCHPRLVPFFFRLGFETHIEEIDHPNFGSSALLKYNAVSPKVKNARTARLLSESAMPKK